MLDIEFISKKSLNGEKVFLYVEEHTFFSRNIERRIRQEYQIVDSAVEISCGSVRECLQDLEEGSLFSSLVKIVPLVDLYMLDANLIPRVLKYITGGGDPSCFLLVLAKSSPHCAAIKNMLPELELIENGTLGDRGYFTKLLSFVLLNDQIVSLPDNVSKETVHKEVLSVYPQFKDMEVSQFLVRVDYLIGVNCDKGFFDSLSFLESVGAAEKVEYYRTHRCIYEFLLRGDNKTAEALYKYIEKMYLHDGVSIRAVCGLVFSALMDLIYCNQEFKCDLTEVFSSFKMSQLKMCRGLPLERLLRFQILFLCCENDIVRSESVQPLQNWLSEYIALS